jgi:hypothetical protein
MNSKIGNKIKNNNDKKDRIKKDIVYTPEEVAIDCIRHTLPFLKDTDVLLEPFTGKDAFYNNFPKANKKDWCEIERGRDYLESVIKCDWAITNPPYSIINDILPKLYECNKGFCLLVNNLTITPPRLKKINDAGFYISLIYYFRVVGWFGCQFYYIFEKREDKRNMLEMFLRQKEYKSIKIDK